jgi:hypothetical protein
VTLIDPPDTDAEGTTRTFSIASPPFENELAFTTRMRDTAFKRSLKKVPLATGVLLDRLELGAARWRCHSRHGSATIPRRQIRLT